MAELFQYLSVDCRLCGKLSRFRSLLEERKGMNASSSFRRFSQNFLGVSNVCPNLCIRRFVTVFRWVGPQERLIDSRGVASRNFWQNGYPKPNLRVCDCVWCGWGTQEMADFSQRHNPSFTSFRFGHKVNESSIISLFLAVQQPVVSSLTKGQ